MSTLYQPYGVISAEASFRCSPVKPAVWYITSHVMQFMLCRNEIVTCKLDRGWSEDGETGSCSRVVFVRESCSPSRKSQTDER